MKPYRLYIDGSWTDSDGDSVLTVLNPATEEANATVLEGTVESAHAVRWLLSRPPVRRAFRPVVKAAGPHLMPGRPGFAAWCAGSPRSGRACGREARCRPARLP